VTLDVDGDGNISEDEFIKGFDEYQEFLEDDMPMCVQEGSGNVGRAPPQPESPSKPKPKPEPKSAKAEEEEEDDDDSDDDLDIMCVEAAPSTIVGRHPPNK